MIRKTGAAAESRQALLVQTAGNSAAVHAPELLAPAGSMEAFLGGRQCRRRCCVSGRAAVSARVPMADNFSDEELKEVI
jgi:collagenase-like PrtC family protease